MDALWVIMADTASSSWFDLTMSALADYGYVGLFIAAFLAATILPLSSEVVLSLLLISGANPYGCLVAASLGNVLGGLTCYWIGLCGKIEWIERYLKIPYEKVERMQRWVKKKGAVLALLSFMPVLGDLIAVALGFMRSNLFLVTLFMTIGKFLRYFLYINLHSYFLG